MRPNDHDSKNRAFEAVRGADAITRLPLDVVRMESINDIFARMKAGELEGRVVLSF